MDCKKIDITTEIADDILFAKVSSNHNITVVKCTLFNFGRTVETINANTNTFEFKLKKTGIYNVKIETKFGNETYCSISMPQIYFLETDERKMYYEYAHIDTYHNSSIKPIKYSSPEYPYSDFAIIPGKIIFSKEFLKENKLYSNHKDAFTIISSMPLEHAINMNVFSGYAYHKNELIFGQKDLTENIELEGDVGKYSLLQIYNDEAIIKTDFFNFEKIFCYKSKKENILSNSYHLLLLVINELNMPVSINEKYLHSLFASYKWLFKEIIFSKKTLFNEIEILPECSKYIINNSELKIIDLKEKTLFSIEPGPLPIKEERELYNAAIEEIRTNISAIFSSKKLGKKYIQVTNGLDSRMVLSATLDITNDFEIETSNMANDLPISLAISNLFGLKYLSDDVSSQPRWDTFNEMRSRCLGLSFNYFTPRIINKNTNNSVTLSGTCGEEFTRSYMSNMIKNTHIEKITDVDQFIEELLLLDSTVPYQTTGNKVCTDAFREILSEELFTYGAKTIVQKMEMLFLYYYGSYHMLIPYATSRGNMYFAPLVSKSLYKLFLKTAVHYKDYRIPFNLVNLMNPILGILPYGKEEYNKKYENLKDELLFEKQYHKNITLSQNYDDSKYWESKRKVKEISKIPLEEIKKKDADYANFIDDLYSPILKILYDLESEIGLNIDNILPTVYILINQSEQKNLKIKELFCTLLSIYDQCGITKKSRSVTQAYLRHPL